MITYRIAAPNDQSHIDDLDLKCHEKPHSPEWWTMVGENTQIHKLVACENQVPIGFMVWEQQSVLLPKRDEEEATLHLHKICVRKEFRRHGIAMTMLAHAHEEAIKNHCKYITIAVPEYRCQPDDPDDVSGWLLNLNFKAQMTLEDKIYLYGKEYDQYLFAFKV